MILKVHLDIFQTPLLATKTVSKVTPSRFEEVRKLDDSENWKERTTVVTKAEHCDYHEAAKEILTDLVDNLPISDRYGKSGCDVVVSMIQYYSRDSL